MARLRRPSVTLIALIGAIGAFGPVPIDALAQPAARQVEAPRAPFAELVGEASRRFAMPEPWIWAVMRAESGGNPRAVSRAGAMGLMQVMPATWAELRTRYTLGRDPFDPRDNIMAGVAYMREMYDAFGSPGFLGAYNAGPNRYAEHLRIGRTLPSETRLYMARVARDMGAPIPPRMTARAPAPQDWTQASLFIARASELEIDSSANAPDAHEDRTAATAESGAAVTSVREPNAIFVPRTAPPR